MRIVYFGKGERGASCLRSLLDAGKDVRAVVTEPGDGSLHREARKAGIPCLVSGDPHRGTLSRRLAALRPDLFILNGYRPILRRSLLSIPRRMSINLHGGALPSYRGSSPMNWALIRGERRTSLSVIRVDEGVDTGDILAERSFRVGERSTIHDLHSRAYEAFPGMLLGVLGRLERGTLRARRQPSRGARYFPARLPEDGLIVWDLMTARQVHDRIRALTEPYPCAFTFWQRLRVRLVASEIPRSAHFGEPGRVYRVRGERMLVCASDRCLWITKAFFAGSGVPAASRVRRYDSFLGVRQALLAMERPAR